MRMYIDSAMSGQQKTGGVALFGGSFNPPHAGHYEIVRQTLEKKEVDEVWVIPVFKHPFGKKLAAFEKRFHQCQELFSDLGSRVKILPVEKKLGGASFTYRLLEVLLKENPGLPFYFVVGQDAYEERKEWKKIGVIEKLIAGFIVYPRGKDSSIPDISSTEIRRKHHDK